MVKASAGVVLDRVGVVFDDQRAVANAGLLLPATLAQRLGIEQLVEECVDLGDRVGAARPGRKLLSLVHGMLAGADSIDDMDVLRSGSTGAVLGHRVMAPSTLGTFLRAFTFGHVRQLDRLLERVLARAWRAGAGPGSERLVIDIDSFIGPVYGQYKQGAAFGYTHQRGYHPLLAVRADTLEVLHIRNRKGSANTQRGCDQFLAELLARVRRCGANGQIVIRADSGFENHRRFVGLDQAGIAFSIGVKMSTRVRAAIAAIPEPAWLPLAEYTGGEAQIAETNLGQWRLLVRRVRNLGPQQQLFATWEHHAFATNRSEPLQLIEAEHRDHAIVEQAIRDLKEQALAHFPSGSFAANSAWLLIAALAHNLGRWTSLLGLPAEQRRTARTRRRRLFELPGRLTRTARRWTLHLPARWPWQQAFAEALTRIRDLPAPG
jgi:Transposase DDE domain group 1